MKPANNVILLPPKNQTMNAEGIHLFQMALNKALTYWLYGSIVSFPNRGRFIGHQISANDLLDVAFQGKASGIALGGVVFQKMVRVNVFAEIIASYFEVWEKHIPLSADSIKLPCSGRYEEWYDEGGGKAHYRPVHSVRELLEKRGGSGFFHKAIVHGSIATLDDTPGFSDMDLAFIVKASVLKDPGMLIKLRGLAAEILTLTYAFDPFMHHGPYYISAMDLAWYPEAIFPSVLYEFGVDLLDDVKELSVSSRPSSRTTAQVLEIFENFFEKWPSNPFMLKDSFDLEWVLGSTMLLPALYLQQKTGVFRYKRDTFSLAEKDFPSLEWEPVRTATQLRSSLPSRPRLPEILTRMSRYLRWPGLLQTVARRHPVSVRRAEQAVEMLGSDYPERVLRLIRAMNGKLSASHRT